MKRAPFLGAAAASFLAGCGGRSLGALSGVTPLTHSQAPSQAAARLVPDVADAIPAAVLASPIIGEYRRFDGQVAPANWMLCQGQLVNVSDDKLLFAILGSIAGGDGKKTFKLPTARGIIAVAGTFPSSPVVMQSGRHMTLADSLGPNAIARPAPAIKPPSPKLLAERERLPKAVRVGSSAPAPMSRDLATRIHQAQDDARETALAKLGGAHQALVLNVVEATAGGRMQQAAAVRQVAAALSDQEASALIDVNDGLLRTFQSGGGGSDRSQVRLAAAYFVVSIAFTPEQKAALAARDNG